MSISVSERIRGHAEGYLLVRPLKSQYRCQLVTESFYHIDRAKSLEQGQTLSLIPVSETEIEQKRLAEEYYPEGVTKHGERYLSHFEPDEDDEQTYWIEAWMEMIRLLEYPDQFSRFQAVFGAETTEEVEQFARTYSSGKEEAVICRVTAERTQTADTMFLSGMRVEMLENIRACRRYWESEIGSFETPRSITEILAEPPVEVVEKVDEISLSQETGE